MKFSRLALIRAICKKVGVKRKKRDKQYITKEELTHILLFVDTAKVPS